jgi:hypothetical protein
MAGTQIKCRRMCGSRWLSLPPWPPMYRKKASRLSRWSHGAHRNLVVEKVRTGAGGWQGWGWGWAAAITQGPAALSPQRLLAEPAPSPQPPAPSLSQRAATELRIVLLIRAKPLAKCNKTAPATSPRSAPAKVHTWPWQACTKETLNRTGCRVRGTPERGTCTRGNLVSLSERLSR